MTRQSARLPELAMESTGRVSRFGSVRATEPHPCYASAVPAQAKAPFVDSIMVIIGRCGIAIGRIEVLTTGKSSAQVIGDNPRVGPSAGFQDRDVRRGRACRQNTSPVMAGTAVRWRQSILALLPASMNALLDIGSTKR